MRAGRVGYLVVVVVVVAIVVAITATIAPGLKVRASLMPARATTTTPQQFKTSNTKIQQLSSLQ